MKRFHLGMELIYTIQQLYTNVTSTVFAQGITGEGCLLSLTLFNIFLERIMSNALEDCVGTVSIGGRTITNLKPADDIDGLAGEKSELASLVSHPHRHFMMFRMKISTKKNSQNHDK